MPRAVDRYIKGVEESFNSYKSEIDNMLKAGENIVSLGMPCVNPISEMFLARVYGIKPFSPIDTPEYSRGYVINDSRKKIKSSLYISKDSVPQGIMNGNASRVLGPYDRICLSYGIILKTAFNESNVLIISGYNGVATIGGVELLSRRDSEVDYINKNVNDPKHADGFLYKTEYETTENVNRDFDGKIESVSVVR